MGAWIEIMMDEVYERQEAVAPLVGAWIEILKREKWNKKDAVAPLVGAWIEIPEDIAKRIKQKSRSSRGSVD